MIRYKNEKENSTKLLKEKAEAELKALKSQLNPHFLFNTLNNIYSLSMIDSDKTRDSIARLSEILDYILYKGLKQTVPISEELLIIDHYIELEMLRFNDRLKIHKVEKLESFNSIPPLLYLSLVENAFKHSVEKTSEIVEINIFVINNQINSVFRIENTYLENSTTNEKGLGLINIKKQLKMYFDDQYEFNIQKDKNTFSAEIITPATK
ncbi:sensor histidine kinase [Chryseobacterium sp. Alg-005]|uniref:sensor histidine kinase n=1 Tax=Chryseobacterium sp. Alg-005 TaxID=3159516 RepID=UPI0036F1B425